MSRLLSSFVAVVLILSVQPVSAQSEDARSLQAATSGNTLVCAGDFDIENLNMNVTRLPRAQQDGGQVNFSGKIQNQNRQAIYDSKLYAQVFRIDDSNSQHMIETLEIADSLFVPGGSVTDFNYSWNTSPDLIAGRYYIEFFLSQIGTGVIARVDSSFFEVGSQGTAAVVVPETFEINGTQFLEFDEASLEDGEPLSVSIVVRNDDVLDTVMPVQWQLLDGFSLEDDSPIQADIEILEIAAETETEITHEFTVPTDARFLISVRIDDGAQSAFSVPIIREAARPALSLAGLTHSGEENSNQLALFYCVENPDSPNANNTELRFSVLNADGTEVATHTAASGAFTEPHVFNLATIDSQMTLVATTLRNGEEVDQVSVAYEVALDDQSVEDGNGSFTNLSWWLMVGIGVMVMLIILIIVAFLIYRKGSSINRMTSE